MLSRGGGGVGLEACQHLTGSHQLRYACIVTDQTPFAMQQDTLSGCDPAPLYVAATWQYTPALSAAMLTGPACLDTVLYHTAAGSAQSPGGSVTQWGHSLTM